MGSLRTQPGALLTRPTSVGARSYARKDYFFPTSWRPGSATARARWRMPRSPPRSRRPSGFPRRWPSLVLLLAGIADECLILVHPLLVVPGIIAAYVALGRVRRVNDVIDAARYHQRFTADVERHARAIAGA